MTKPDPAGKHTKHTHEHPFLEAFNAEDIIEHPGEIREEPDTTSDSDAPAP